MRSPLSSIVSGAILLGCGPVEVTMFESLPPEEAPPPPVLGLGGERPVDDGSGGGTQTTFLLDDFEDADQRGNAPAGWWYIVNDGTGTQNLSVRPLGETAAPPRVPSGLILESQLSGFTDWGAAIGIDIAEIGPKTTTLSLTFSIAASRDTEVTFHVLDGSDSHFTKTLFVSAAWRIITLELDDLFIVEGNSVRHLDVKSATELQWFLLGDTPTTLWFDDVTLRY